MNVNGLNPSFRSSFHSCMGAFKMESSLCRFISIIMNTKAVKEASRVGKLATWLKGLSYDLNEVKDHLGLNKMSTLQAIKERLKIARIYASILNSYVPDEDGDIGQVFEYFQLVDLVKEVFKSHIGDQSGDLFKNGLTVFVNSFKFFAKVESCRVSMFLARPKLIHEERLVATIYEIASKQILAVKWTDVFTNKKIISREVSNIQSIHARGDFEDFDLEWMQACPLATFSLNQFYGFLGEKYGENLIYWSNDPHSNEERISMCKSIMKAYAKIRKLEYWHGDIKPDNIVVKGNEAVFIDWSGSRPFHEVKKPYKMPKSVTSIYVNLDIYKSLLAIQEQFKKSGPSDELKLQFNQLGESLDFFSLGITLFYVLVPIKPFHLVLNEECDINFPLTSEGIKRESMARLLERNYSDSVVGTIKDMLADLTDDRMTPTEAIAIWENVK